MSGTVPLGRHCVVAFTKRMFLIMESVMISGGKKEDKEMMCASCQGLRRQTAVK